MKSAEIILLVFIILAFTCPLIAATMLHSGWYLLGWIMTSGFTYKSGNEEDGE